MSEDGSGGWISWLVTQPGHGWLVEVDVSFIEDAFNLYGLRSEVPRFRECLELMTGPEPNPDAPEWDAKMALFPSARDLYGLIHARFLLTSRGVSLAQGKYEDGEFGACPRNLCHGTPCLPVGKSTSLREAPAMLFCPRCEDVYRIPASTPAETGKASAIGCAPAGLGIAGVAAPGDLDGAYFGPSSSHMVLLMKPHLMPVKPSESYVPRVYGFRIHNQRGRAPLTVGDSRGPYAPAEVFELPVGASPPSAVAAGDGAAGGRPGSPRDTFRSAGGAAAAPSSASRSSGGKAGGPHAGSKRPRPSDEAAGDNEAGEVNYTTVSGTSVSNTTSSNTTGSGTWPSASSAAAGSFSVRSSDAAGGSSGVPPLAARLRAKPSASAERLQASSGGPPFVAPYITRLGSGVPGGVPVYLSAAVAALRDGGAAVSGPAWTPGDDGDKEALAALKLRVEESSAALREALAAGASQPSSSGAGAGKGGGSAPIARAASAPSAIGDAATPLSRLLPARRSGIPLTSPYGPDGRRPAADDFNSDSDDNATPLAAASSSAAGRGSGTAPSASPPSTKAAAAPAAAVASASAPSSKRAKR